MISQEGGCEEDVRYRVKSVLVKWHDISVAVCDKRMPVKQKTHIYKT